MITQTMIRRTRVRSRKPLQPIPPHPHWPDQWYLNPHQEQPSRGCSSGAATTPGCNHRRDCQVDFYNLNNYQGYLCPSHILSSKSLFVPSNIAELDPPSSG